MSDFIDQLKQEHIAIRSRIRDARREGIHTMEGRDELFDTRDQLMEHLHKESLVLFPSLEKYAENDNQLKSLVVSCVHDFNSVIDFCDYFFDKYAIGGGGIDFFKDFEKLDHTLSKEIETEETVLFPKYEKLYCYYKVR